MVILCCGFMAAATTNAQTCPSDLVPTNIPWSWGCKNYTMQWPNGNTCLTWICYCYRQVSGKTQIFLSSVGAAAPCPGSGWSAADLNAIYTNARMELLKDNEVAGNCPPCPQGIEVEVVSSFCAKEDVDSGGNPVMTICSGSGYCFQTWRRCCDDLLGGAMVLTLLGSSSSGSSSCAVGCSSVCP